MSFGKALIATIVAGFLITIIGIIILIIFLVIFAAATFTPAML
jgi:hypothetical protein